MRNTKNCACANCERRGCGAYHDICPEYKKYKQAAAEKNKINRAGKEVDNAFSEHLLRHRSAARGEKRK